MLIVIGSLFAHHQKLSGISSGYPDNSLDISRKCEPVIKAGFPFHPVFDPLPKIPLEVRLDSCCELHNFASDKFPESIESCRVIDPDMIGKQSSPNGFQVSQQDAPADNSMGPVSPVLLERRDKQ